MASEQERLYRAQPYSVAEHGVRDGDYLHPQNYLDRHTRRTLWRTRTTRAQRQAARRLRWAKVTGWVPGRRDAS